AWWCLAAGLVSPRFFTTRESMMPSKTYYVGAWQWDAFFHALAYRHVDMRLAEDHLRIWLDHQRADGMLPDAVHDEDAVFAFVNPRNQQLTEVTKPPLIAWAALKLYEHSGNLDFLQEVYEPITRWNEWWFANNDDDRDGLVQYSHPYCDADDSPLWDEGMPVESPDINTYLVMQMDALARIAELIGEGQDALRWRARAEELTQRMIAHMWDEEAGFFWALKDERPLHIETLFNVYPLLTGRLPAHIAARLVEHLRNPDEFWTEFPLPTVSQRDPRFDPNQMWRGPTWANVNYLFVEGLAKCGYPDLARELRERTLAMVMRHADIYEYYNPLTGERPPKAAGMFGWTSAVCVDLLQSDVVEQTERA
ncbi:MAG: glycogen debranching protein, partial [Chloroflexi bacterium]|nr:glycogen debranching protein [Chloroflexota bacterium]